jgi:hypothetical protein
MKLRALLLLAAAAVAAAAHADDAPTVTTYVTRRALKELHLPALVSETGTSEVVGKGTPRRDNNDDDGGDETLSTGITKVGFPPGAGTFHVMSPSGHQLMNDSRYRPSNPSDTLREWE